jgi:hypothetical protein
VPYRTIWVPLCEVAATRNSLQLPANHKHQNGSPFPTLPIIQDPLAVAPAATTTVTSDKAVVIGDSFDIALHLQNTYLSVSPNAEKRLFPGMERGVVALHRAFNMFVDEIFRQYGAPLAGTYMPFDPRTAQSDKAAFEQRFPGNMKWDQFEIPQGSDPRKKMLFDFRTALDEKLAPCFQSPGVVGPDGVARKPNGDGPFMDGRESPMYADFIVGGWLQFLRGCLPEWPELRDSWSDGRWGKLFNALEVWASIDGRDGVIPARP